ncbi:3-isopropylmalate dehydratase small subunit [Pseudoroseomonas cervicalis]|uniref:3-isopropylmalate dehydratase small subunit n=1 Tax=Teichococcus cervicalis TaxID=204525 RepID=UPI002786FB68|nr:3-isopropylmalate dehydratase small subunit [Pseudoroseomonas cervicalis]MDQ1078986.1 3-isopropylmalate/(R)-2-methylmalate dehydratase small subunit [Pseudoroseomonas cervicalis]
MRPFTRLDATACPLPLANVDTDQLIPARFMKRPRSEGYGQFLLYDLRFAEDGAVRGDSPIDAPERAGAEILVARRNFGSGSSREAAVYALVDGGFRCVLAPSFGDIFSSNAVNNGLLPARLAEGEIEALLAWLRDGGRSVTVDLEACTVAAGELRFGFSIDPVWRVKLLNGWNDLDLTLSHAEAIADFATRDAQLRPWAQLPAKN